jgi:hypothetical protein
VPETIESLKDENARLRKHILDYRMIDDLPLLKHYQPFTDRNKPSQLEFDVAIDKLRQLGAGTDGDNAYKRDLCDVISGAMALGYQNTNAPPEGHWAKRFWDIGRAEGAAREGLTAALKLNRENLRACQATIHLCGGFDPAYVNDAQAAMTVADQVLAKYPPLDRAAPGETHD